MRRKNRKGRIRTNKTIKRCPSCEKNCKDIVDDNVTQAIIDETYEYEDYYEDDFKSQRKRLNKKYPYEEEDVVNEKEEAKTKHEVKKEMWKKADKKFIMKKMGEYKSKVIGGLIRGCIISKTHQESRNELPKRFRGGKGIHKHKTKLQTFCKDSNTDQTIERFKTFHELSSSD